MKTLLAFSAVLLSVPAFASVNIDRVTAIVADRSGTHAEIKPIAYPDPQPGYKIVVVHPGYDPLHLEHNANKQVELLFSHIESTDMCNYLSYRGSLEEKEVPGAEYESYFVLEKGGETSTLMGCPPGRRTQAVPIFHEKGMLAFADAFVLYVPADVDVAYRVWQPGAVTPASDKQ